MMALTSQANMPVAVSSSQKVPTTRFGSQSTVEAHSPMSLRK